MSGLDKLACMLLLSMFAAFSIAAPSAVSVDDPAGVAAYMDGHVETLMRTNRSASGVVVILRGGEPLYTRGFGFQDFNARIPIDPSYTLFRPGSISKLFTWIAVMQLYEQGKLDLDADVNEYLQTFQIEETFAEPVTLRHIMTHTAGFEDGGLGYLIVIDEEKLLPLGVAMQRYQPRRVNPPGTQTAYSNYATALAGLIVANVSGENYNDYVQANIFDVLVMTRSTFHEPLPAHLQGQEAIGYQAEGGTFSGKAFELVGSFGPAGGLSSTAADISRFATAIIQGGELDGGRILRAETMQEMLSRAFSHDDRLMGMALGFYESDENGVRLVGHGGDLFHMHADLSLDLENNISIFAAFTGDGGSTVRSTIVPAFYDRFFPRDEEPPVPPQDFADRAAKYAGSYKFWRQNFSTIEKALALAPGVTITPTGERTLLLSFAGGAKQYVEVQRNLFRQLNQEVVLSPRLSPRLIAFQENPDGSIRGMVMDYLPFMSLYRSPAYANAPFNALLLGFSLLVFVAVLLRLACQWSTLRAMNSLGRSATRVSVAVAASNLLFFVVATLVVSSYGETLYTGLPLVFKAMLILPVLAFIAGAYHAYTLIAVWKHAALGSLAARLRYSVVTFCALFLCWFYYYWNILGFQYLG